MLKIISKYLLCILITAPCINIHAMKRAVQADEQTDGQSPIVSFPSEILTIIAAMYQRRNTLTLVCKAFHAAAMLYNWKALVGSGHIYLSPRDQERIGAIILDEDEVELMEKMLDKYPAYANHVPSFALNIPLCFARSSDMKTLLEEHGAYIESEQDTVSDGEDEDETYTMNISGINRPCRFKTESLAYYTGQCLQICTEQVPGIEISVLYDFFRAILKGDINTVDSALQSSEFERLCKIREFRTYARTIIEEALRTAATYGHYDIVMLLLRQPVNLDYLGQTILQLALGADDVWDNVNAPPFVYMPHQEVAQLLITDNRIEELNLFLKDTITSDSPAIVEAMLKRPKTVVTFKDLKFTTERGNEEISAMIARDLTRRKKTTTEKPKKSDTSDSAEESNDD